MSANLELIDTLLASQVRAIRWQLVLAALLIVIGLLMFFVGSLTQPVEKDASNTLLKALGAGASSLSAFPIKDLIVRREKSDALKLLKLRLRSLESEPQRDAAEIERITTMLWASVKTIIER